MIRITRSFIAADALAELIEQEYGLPAPVECKLFSKLLRTQDNDHYLVTAGPNKYVMRVYQLGKHLQRHESDYRYELDWLNFLHQHKLPVAYPIARQNGSFLGQLDAPEGLRYYAMFSLALGNSMNVNNQNQLFALGSNMAQIHRASDQYNNPHSRKPMDLDFLIDKPLRRLSKYWEHHRVQNVELLSDLAAEAKVEIETWLASNPPAGSWGPIGGDFHSSSVFFNDKNEPTFFNFDLCGPGWRAYDIASFLLNTELMRKPQELSEAFFAGYYSVRPLSDGEHEIISTFLTVRRIWLTSIFSLDDGLVGHTFIAPA